MIVIDYVDGHARTERIINDSGGMSSSSTSSLSSSSIDARDNNITEVLIHPPRHGGSLIIDDKTSFQRQRRKLMNITAVNHSNQFFQHNHSGTIKQYPNYSHSEAIARVSHKHNHPISTYLLLSQDRDAPTIVKPENKEVIHSSDSSSAYSGSDTMQSIQSSINIEDVDLSGLMESVVDSDEEENSVIVTTTVQDAVRECLEKDPSDRSPSDIEILLEFTRHLKAFTNMTLSVRQSLVATMVFAVVEKAGTIVMTDNEELDSWSVIINGFVEIQQLSGGPINVLQVGDSFGITPTMEKLYHRGIMRTKCDDCQFVCVTQTDYYRILHQGQENQIYHKDNNSKVVLVTEYRTMDSGSLRGQVVIRGSPDRLIRQLVEDTSCADATFIEDFLLTYRTFIESPLSIMEKLLQWFREDASIRDRVTRVVLLWVNNHFTDFEVIPAMMDYLETFEIELRQTNMQSQQRMLNFACAAKAKRRTVTLSRSSRDELLSFSIVGDDSSFGVFISNVEYGSKALEIGLKRGDQILEINGQNFERVMPARHTKALDVLKSVCHLSITVKSNLLAYREMHEGRKYNDEYTKRDDTLQNIKPNSAVVSSSKSRINRAFNKILLHKPKSLINMDSLLYFDEQKVLEHPSLSMSNPDLSKCLPNDSASSVDDNSLRSTTSNSIYPEHILKIYRADQSSKYILIHKETNAREVVMLSLREFGITQSSAHYALCEVTVDQGGFIKQRRLQDSLQNLAERIGLSSRYYLRNINTSENILPDENFISDLAKEGSSINLLNLNPIEVATQLMVEDFIIFRQIEPIEYVDDLFNLHSRYGTPCLSHFSELVNREMMWTITETVSEPNVTKRMRTIKQFVKIAHQCKETQNFNSMFAIISGLGHGAVSRLKQSWEKLPTKYQQLFLEMQQLMDPSRNMSRYRNLVNGQNIKPPIIPFYPVVKKDLTFIHLANDSLVEDLINFEKLRMIAKEIRNLINMCAAPLDLFSMLELGGQNLSNAMIAMNQLSTGANASGRRSQVPRNISRKRKKSVTPPNPKKMFEESQMVRRVKTYLKNMKTINDEDVLQKMSFECEPPSDSTTCPAPLNSNSSNSSFEQHQLQETAKRRNSSPTPSSALSSTSSSSCNDTKGGPSSSIISSQYKFGAASPHSIRKLMSLSQQSKTRLKLSPSASSSYSAASSRSTKAVDLTVESSSVVGTIMPPFHATSNVNGTVSKHFMKNDYQLGKLTEKINFEHSESRCDDNIHKYHQKEPFLPTLHGLPPSPQLHFTSNMNGLHHPNNSQMMNYKSENSNLYYALPVKVNQEIETVNHRKCPSGFYTALNGDLHEVEDDETQISAV